MKLSCDISDTLSSFISEVCGNRCSFNAKLGRKINSSFTCIFLSNIWFCRALGRKKKYCFLCSTWMWQALAANFWAFIINCLPSLSHWGQTHMAGVGSEPGLLELSQTFSCTTAVPKRMDTLKPWHGWCLACGVLAMKRSVPCRGAFTHLCSYSAARCSDGKFSDCK